MTAREQADALAILGSQLPILGRGLLSNLGPTRNLEEHVPTAEVRVNCESERPRFAETGECPRLTSNTMVLQTRTPLGHGPTSVPGNVCAHPERLPAPNS